MRFVVVLWAACCVVSGCTHRPAPGRVATPDGVAPDAVFGESERVILGEPLAVAVDFSGRAVVADGSPGRLVRWIVDPPDALEFQEPTGAAGFYPTDVAIRGFFVYAVDETARRILRFDDDGAFRDVLLNFEELSLGRRVSPYALAVDETGRFAVTDIENHQVLVFDSYLALETAFGHYGTYEGQLDTPMGVSFSPRGDLVVVDTGNRRIQVFSGGGAFERTLPAPGQPNPLRRPRRASVLDDGRVCVADPDAGGVYIFDPSGALERVIVPSGAVRFAPTDVEGVRGSAVFVTDEASRSVLVFRGI